MDKFETGVFEISTAFNDFWQDWQVGLAEADLIQRATRAMYATQRLGVPYVTCLYPVEKKDGKLVLRGFCALAQWEDCEVGEACAMPFPLSGSLQGVRREWQDDYYDRFEFVYDNNHHEVIYIYRRVL